MRDELIKKCDNVKLCPKQVIGDNRVITYKLYYVKLKRTLENVSAYLEFLNEKDECGDVSDKILSIMQLRIHYYVGFLASKDKSNFALMKKGEWQNISFNDGKLRSDKYYFYFMQPGKCMYTGHAIDFARLGGDAFLGFGCFIFIAADRILLKR